MTSSKPQDPSGVAAMTRNQLQDLLDRYGPRPGDWPDTLRRQAEAALARHAELRTLLTAEQALADALSSLPAAPASAELRRAVLDIPIDNPRTLARPSLLPGIIRAWRRWTAGMATATAAGLFGFVLGYGQLVALPATAGEQVASDDLLSLLNQSTEIDTTELESAQ